MVISPEPGTPALTQKIAAAALDISAWLGASGEHTSNRFDEMFKECIETTEPGEFYLMIPMMEIIIPFVSRVESMRYTPIPKRESQRHQSGEQVQHWDFYSSTDSAMTVSVARVDEGDGRTWSLHVERRGIRQHLDRFSVPAKYSDVTGITAAPDAARYGLAIGTVLLQLQNRIEELCGARTVAPRWEPDLVIVTPNDEAS